MLRDYVLSLNNMMIIITHGILGSLSDFTTVRDITNIIGTKKFNLIRSKELKVGINSQSFEQYHP